MKIKEYMLTTFLSDESAINVYFDYSPSEPKTDDCPASPAEVTINQIDSGGVAMEFIDIPEYERIKVECFKMMAGK